MLANTIRRQRNSQTSKEQKVAQEKLNHVPPDITDHQLLHQQQDQIHHINNKNNYNNNNNIIVNQLNTTLTYSDSKCISKNVNIDTEKHLLFQQQPVRSLDQLKDLVIDKTFDKSLFTNEEIITLVKNHLVPVYKLETFLGIDNASRCVEIRRQFYQMELAELDSINPLGINNRSLAFPMESKYEDLNYKDVIGACCENVIGYVKVPVGIAGPLILDDEVIFVPLATTEGCLVASTNRGFSAFRKSGGVLSRVRADFMTRAPVVRFMDEKWRDAINNVDRAIAWLNDKNNKEKIASEFNKTSNYARFIDYTLRPFGREIHIRFEAKTGDAMGMNMCSKGVECALKMMQNFFPTMEVYALSGNMCTDKKPAAINWIRGRGKSVECSAELTADVVKQVFKVSVDALIGRYDSKIRNGSTLAGCMGGFNCQAANILTAIFIATGQDPAQNVTSSNCMLTLEKGLHGSLVVCCTMPSIECGTVGGGTELGDQSRYLQMMGIKGPTLVVPQPNKNQRPSMSNEVRSDSSLHNNSISETNVVCDNEPCSSNSTLRPDDGINDYTNAKKLSRIICASVMAGEISLLAALSRPGDLVEAHKRYNKSSTNSTAATNFSMACNSNQL